MEHRKPEKAGKDAAQGTPGKPADDEKPGWANGLKQLYNSVVDEPLPDSFKDLIERLDDAG